ncbi:MAG: tetratricopeptide repeat protein, partial [Actinomycetota bacterium]|nr:tetratricopeptide repeat protein [Actinomycetota bacterium]
VHDRGEDAEALELLRNVTGSFRAAGLAGRIRLEQTGEPAYAEGLTALDAGDHEHGLDVLLDALPAAGDQKDDVRKVIVAVLHDLGVEHPVARESRRRLAAALY